MNTSRRTILVAYLLGVTLLCLWLPWRLVWVEAPQVPMYVGYNFVWKGPPLPKGRSPEAGLARVTAQIDLVRLALSLTLLTSVAGVAFLVVPAKSS